MVIAKIFKITPAASLAERSREPFARPRTGPGPGRLVMAAPPRERRFAKAGGRRPPTSAVRDVGATLFQLIRHLVEAGLGAGFILVPAGSAGDADGADHRVADLDRQRALSRDHAG
jgi:hypothetical protein